MKNTRVDFITEGVGVFFTAVQTEQIFQIISLVLTIASIIVSLAFTLYKWWKEAKKDGKIDKEEIKDLTEKVTEAGKEISDTVSKISEAKDKKEN